MAMIFSEACLTILFDFPLDLLLVGSLLAGLSSNGLLGFVAQVFTCVADLTQSTKSFEAEQLSEQTGASRSSITPYETSESDNDLSQMAEQTVGQSNDYKKRSFRLFLIGFFDSLFSLCLSGSRALASYSIYANGFTISALVTLSGLALSSFCLFFLPETSQRRELRPSSIASAEIVHRASPNVFRQLYSGLIVWTHGLYFSLKVGDIFLGEKD
ncbi:unnamed protein product [Protopolystoma xenopodis]|uniref:Uncharacterized protein n=1 Tax=Protopolystoma xenopodis TaxID=117903 RepID=A0A3S4ZU50_9PLAT|nr:unnamed protein product [Protopolystoma xenopodis]